MTEEWMPGNKQELMSAIEQEWEALIQLADSLTAAHKKQIVHRDPSPISTRKPPQQIGLSTSTRGPTRLLSKWTTQQLHRPKCGSRSAKHDRLLRRPSRSCDLAGLKRQTRSSRENSPHRD